MRFTTPFTLLAAISGAHSLVVERDASDVKKVIDDICGGVSSLDQAAKSWDGSRIEPVLAHVENLIRLIIDGQAVVDSAGPIGLFDAGRVHLAAQNLDAKISHSFNTFRGSVGHVRKAKGCDLVHEKLTTVSAGGKRLIDAILSKVSYDWARNLARPNTDNIKKMLHDAQGLFAQTNCVNE